MIGANLFFHVASLVGLLGLVYLVARLMSERRVMRDLLGKKVVLAPPHAYATGLARYLGIAVTGHLSAGELPKRVKGRALLEFVMQVPVKEVHTDGVCLTFQSPGPKPDGVEWSDILTSALNTKVSVIFDKEGV